MLLAFPDASFRLIKETEAALGTIDRLVLEAAIESSWDTWGSKSTSLPSVTPLPSACSLVFCLCLADSQPLPSHFLVSHPTTRSLLISVVKHIQAFCSFFAGVNAPLSAPNLSLPPGSSILVTEMAKGLLADIQRRAALGQSSALSEALEAVRGVMPKSAFPPLSSPLHLMTLTEQIPPPPSLSQPHPSHCRILHCSIWRLPRTPRYPRPSSRKRCLLFPSTRSTRPRC